MNGVNPEIMNRLRAERGLGSNSITPVYHLPDIPKPREPQADEAFGDVDKTPEHTHRMQTLIGRLGTRITKALHAGESRDERAT